MTLCVPPAARVLNEIKNRNELVGDAVEDVILGNVTQVGEQGACLARTAVLASDLDEAIPGLAINRFCGRKHEPRAHDVRWWRSGR